MLQFVVVGPIHSFVVGGRPWERGRERLAWHEAMPKKSPPIKRTMLFTCKIKPTIQNKYTAKKNFTMCLIQSRLTEFCITIVFWNICRSTSISKSWWSGRNGRGHSLAITWPDNPFTSYTQGWETTLQWREARENYSWLTWASWHRVQSPQNQTRKQSPMQDP